MESKIVISIFWLILWITYVHSQSPILSGKEKPCRKPFLEITVSPLVTSKSLRILDVSWDLGDSWSKNSWIGLYNVLPNKNATPLYRMKINKPSGWSRTDIQERRKFQENPNFNKVCLGFWIAYWKDGQFTPVTTSCLGTNPNWMSENKSVLRNLKINDMFIPGTHDSAAFHLKYTPFQESRLNKYVFAQDENIIEQLIHGARYLDFRIGHYNGIWWLNHGVIKVQPLEHVLDDVKLFLNNTKEILVIDFHLFPVGFQSKETHHQLVKYLRKELGSYIAPPWLGWNANLGQLWDRNKRLILAYNDRSIVSSYSDLLWWPVSQKWPDVRSLSQLYTYFHSIFKEIEKKGGGSNKGQAWSAMAELTPDAWGVISDQYHGLRNMADQVNHNVTNWFRNDWGLLCNAVAVDFIRSTGIVQAAIRWNLRKASKSNCDN